MTIKSILVPLSEPRLVNASFKAAVKVATPFAAHIEVLHALPEPQLIAATYMSEAMSGAMIEQMIKDTEQKSSATARKTREAVKAAAAAANIRYSQKPGRAKTVTVSWREDVGYEDQLLRTCGRVSDLIVLPRPATDIDVGVRLSLEAALMDTGRPLLVVPPKLPSKIGSNIAIAWNGSAEAARAVGDARPFLANARKVTILTATEPNLEDLEPEGLSRWLAWHGIKASVLKVRARGDVGKALLSAADKLGADLLVMGAYSHSRVREMILGGVTRHVLTGTNIPALMTH